MKPYLASKELGEHVLILGPCHPTILTDLLETSEKVDLWKIPTIWILANGKNIFKTLYLSTSSMEPHGCLVRETSWVWEKALVLQGNNWHTISHKSIMKTRTNCSRKFREIESGSGQRWLAWQGCRIIFCKRPVPPDDHLREAGSSGWSFASGRNNNKNKNNIIINNNNNNRT